VKLEKHNYIEKGNISKKQEIYLNVAVNWRSIGNKFDYFCVVFFFLAVSIEITTWVCFTWDYL